MRIRSSILAATVLLAGCSSSSVANVPSLSSDEVLSRAAKATHTLQSAQYTAEGTFETKANNTSTSGTFRMDGMLQDAGAQLRFQLDLDADIKDPEQPSTISGTVEVVMISPKEVYMNLHSLTSQPDSTVFSPAVIAKLAGKWWALPEGDTPPVVGTVTPDPRLLDAQAQVVEVTRDRGVEEVNGIPSYHYDVTLNKEKLIAYLAAIAEQKGEEFSAQETADKLKDVEASGQLWIDAKNFYMQKITWVLQSLPTDAGIASASITITFRNHDNAPQIIPPTDYTEFTPSVLFTLPTDAMFPEELKENPVPNMDDSEIESLMQQLDSM